MKEVVGKKRNVHVASFIFLWGSAESTHWLAYDRKALFYDRADEKCYLYTSWQNSIIVNK